MEYTVQQMIDFLNEVEDKNKLMYVEGLSEYGSYYDVKGFDIELDEDYTTVTLRVDKYSW